MGLGAGCCIWQKRKGGLVVVSTRSSTPSASRPQSSTPSIDRLPSSWYQSDIHDQGTRLGDFIVSNGGSTGVECLGRYRCRTPALKRLLHRNAPKRAISDVGQIRSPQADPKALLRTAGCPHIPDP